MRLSYTSIDVRTGTDSKRTEAWLPIKTTCGCTVPEASGMPLRFRPVQGFNLISFEITDGSGCEEGFVFQRNNVNLEAQFTRRLECFETVITQRQGDNLIQEDENQQNLLNIGETYVASINN